MGFPEDMMNLGEKLLSSCENRKEAVRGIVQNTRKTLTRFKSENRQMAKNLRHNLCEFKDGLEDNTHKMMRRFRAGHKDMAKKQRGNLRDFMDTLVHTTGGFIRKCHKKHNDMHNMFVQAHKSFLSCMRGIEKMKGLPRDNGNTNRGKKGRRKRTSH
jgi:hypothetical protein